MRCRNIVYNHKGGHNFKNNPLASKGVSAVLRIIHEDPRDLFNHNWVAVQELKLSYHNLGVYIYIYVCMVVELVFPI